jgi:CRP-like cAMP-binding protein
MKKEKNKPSCPGGEVMARGGILVAYGDFFLQIGAYPETIKDTIKTKKGVPDLYLLPEELFDTEAGISAADLEFPVYFNYYMKGRKLRFICRKHQMRPLLRVLKEGLFGPRVIRTEQEFKAGKDSPGYPDLRKEMAFFKEDKNLAGGRLRLKHVVEPILFDTSMHAVIDGVRLTETSYDTYRIELDKSHCDIRYQTAHDIVYSPQEKVGALPSFTYYEPPPFGITVIGSGHGFDVGSSTSGFIIWLDGKGILIDPPVNSTSWLKNNHINARLIEDLVLTHCHADHDSGTLQKILEEGRMRLHTTETIMRSFMTKYCALTGLTPAEFQTLFAFDPISINQFKRIAGGEFRFGYTFHSIPTIGFELTFHGKSFAYSSDTLYEPETLLSLKERGIVTEERLQDLLNFPWNDTVVFHEAGPPPIHTPIEVLASLPDEIKKHLYIIHIAEDSIPPGKGLKLAKSGVENTIHIDIPPPETSMAHKMLDVMAHIDLFQNMPVQKALEFLAITHYSAHEPGRVVIERNTYGDRFYMILSGEVEVLRANIPRTLVYSKYDYLGEMAIVLDQPRSADVVARSHTELLYMERHDFLHFIRDTNLKEFFERLALNRNWGVWWLFEENRILQGFSPLQKNQLMCIMHAQEVEKGTILYSLDKEFTSYFIIDTGQVMITRDEKEVIASRGTVIGEFDRAGRARHHSSTACALTDLSLYRISTDELKLFFRANPGTYVRLFKTIP